MYSIAIGKAKADKMIAMGVWAGRGARGAAAPQLQKFLKFFGKTLMIRAKIL